MRKLKQFGYVRGDEYCDSSEYVNGESILVICSDGQVDLINPSKKHRYETTIDVLKAIIEEYESYWGSAEEQNDS